MSDSLRELEILALDCQATGASPGYGDLLELGWARCGPEGVVGSIRSSWIVPRTSRPIRRAVRELTGWTEACMAEAVDEREAWDALRADAARLAGTRPPARAPTVIHFARFELPFLEDLHGRLDRGEDFPLDAICLHRVATKLFPDLPRRNIRALAGYLGHSPDLVRRSAGHVEATVFIWRALLPVLDEKGISTWDDLKSWLDQATPNRRRLRRVYPLLSERRRALPDRAGVYRFLRRNGDVLYVGKATSLRKRIAGHFKSRGPVTERGLELLTQVHDVDHTETASLIEAALLESDEIKRLDPPYNVQLRFGDRSAWFSSRDFRNSSAAPDAAHPIGPLPSGRAVAPLSALIAIADGADACPALRAQALAVPVAFLPADELFAAGWNVFFKEHLCGPCTGRARRVLDASLALWLARGRSEIESSLEEPAPDVWDLARVRRRLERSLVQTGLLVRRARFLCLLVDSIVAFRERGGPPRRLVLSGGAIVDRGEIDGVSALSRSNAARPRPLYERRAVFDAAMYDRLRVLVTELRRVLDQGGEVSLRVGAHTFVGERLARLFEGI